MYNLRNDDIIGDAGNIFPEFTNTAEHGWLTARDFLLNRVILQRL